MNIHAHGGVRTGGLALHGRDWCSWLQLEGQHKASEARQHAAGHLLASPQLPAVARLKMPCGLCASFEQQQWSADTESATGCMVRVEKKSGAKTIPVKMGHLHPGEGP